MAVNPVFDLAEEAFKDYSIENLTHYKILENQRGIQMANSTTDDVKTLRFRIDDMNNWINVGRSYIKLEGELVQKTAAAVKPGYGNVANDAALQVLGGKALLNNSAAIFRRCTLKANGITVESSLDNKMFDVTIGDLLNNDSEYAMTYGSTHNYYHDNDQDFGDGGWRYQIEPINSNPGGAAFNVAERCFKSRCHAGKPFADGLTEQRGHSRSLIVNGRKGLRPSDAANWEHTSFEVIVPLNKVFHVLKAHDKIVRGIQWEIELEFENSNRCVAFGAVDGATAVPVFQFKNRCAELYLERVTPRIEVRNVLNNLLLNGFKKSINYEDVQVYHTSIGSGAANGDWRIATTVSRPTKLFFFAQYALRDGAPIYDSQTFDFAGMERVSCRVNGIKYPDEDYEMKPEDNNSEVCVEGGFKPAVDLLKMKGLDVSEHTDMLNRGCFVNSNNWNSHYPIYAFDLTKYPGDALFSGSSEIMISYKKKAATAASLNSRGVDANGLLTALGAPGDSNVNLYAVLYHEKVVELSMSQNESSIVIQ